MFQFESHRTDQLGAKLFVDDEHNDQGRWWLGPTQAGRASSTWLIKLSLEVGLIFIPDEWGLVTVIYRNYFHLYPLSDWRAKVKLERMLGESQCLPSLVQAWNYGA